MRLKKMGFIFCITFLMVVMNFRNDVKAQEISVDASGTCGENLTWEFSADGALKIDGTGEMTDFTTFVFKVPWYDYTTDITNVIISEGVTSIGDYAFYNCISLNKLTIPKNLTSIGERAFSSCNCLSSISVSKENMWFEDYDSNILIENNSKTLILVCKNSVIPNINKIEILGDYLFYEDENLNSIYIPDSVKIIGNYAFSGCSGLANINIPEGVTSIGTSAFSGCSGLTNINIPDSVSNIESGTFWDCSSLTSIDIPEGVTNIGSMAFLWMR